MKQKLLLIFLFSTLSLQLPADECDLFHDLELVEAINRRMAETVPVTYNYLLYGGYFNMPSALMGKEGEMGLGFSYVSPYHNYNLRYQFSDYVELSGNYRVFRGIDDPILSPSGFGDRSDKGVNIKFALLSPRESNYLLPGVAIGFEDFLGTKNFESRYLVFTQVFRNLNAEVSIGYGKQRIKGFFGGFTWLPLLKCGNPYFENLAFSAEYDATNYKNDPHPGGRDQKSPINFGMKYRLFNFFDFSTSYVRGKKLAFAVSAFYNFGYTPGIQCKRDDPLPYRNSEPPGPLCCDDPIVISLISSFQEQFFKIEEVWLSKDCKGNKILRITLCNDRYRYESDVRERLNHLLAYTIPPDISNVVVVMDTQGLPIQEYHFTMSYVRLFKERQVGTYELHVLSPLADVTFDNPGYDDLLFYRKHDLWNFKLMPKYISFFGSSKGKFKYALGVHAALNGYLWKDVYYSVLAGYDVFKNLYDLKDSDKLNPSQLINVRTDIVNYLKQDGITVDEAYLQKNWNMGKGWFSRASVGIFEIEYGGFAAEVLWYPTNSSLALGLEGAVLRKRTYSGIGFTDKIRQLHGFQPSYHRFLGSQGFLNAYYHLNKFDIDLEFKVGKFLANDVGIRNVITKTYPSGTSVSIWCTYTNGNDRINGRRYYDKGIEVSIPLDIFYSYSSKDRWNYGMSAWLRDVGVMSYTGKTLYRLIRDERNP
jgi:hypothetical protein